MFGPSKEAWLKKRSSSWLTDPVGQEEDDGAGGADRQLSKTPIENT
jgi:hypothetical protein